MSFRDANVIIIEVSRTVVRASLGLHELLKTPSVEISACVGIRTNGSGEVQNGADGVIEQKNTANDNVASSSRFSTLPQHSVPNATVKDYLVGPQLDEALASGQEVLISWPFADNDVRDWTQAEAIWKYLIFTHLQRRRTQNESPVLLCIAAGISRFTYERICQMFFERFNVPGFAILERPIAQIYASNSLTGIVVEIDEEKTDITPIYENFINYPTCATVSVGARECRYYLAHLLKSNTSVMQSLSPADNPLEPENLHQILLDIVKQVLEEGLIKVPSDGETAVQEDEGVTDIAAVVVAGKERAVIESGLKKKLTAKASAAEQARAREIEALDLVTIQFRGQSVTLGKERHRFCEPLFDPSLLNTVPGIPPRRDREQLRSLQDVVGHAVSLIDIEQRQYIWQGLVVTGDITKRVKGLAVALQSRLAPLLAQPDLATDIQPRSIRVLAVPDYYAEYRDTGNGYAAFLGSSVTAKIVFNDSNGKNYVSKADYSSKGPHSIIEMTPALL